MRQMLKALLLILVTVALLTWPVLFPVATLADDPGSVADHLVISEVQIKGDGDTQHDFIEIYNPTSGQIDLGDYNLRKIASTGTESSIKSPIASSGTYIQPGGFYLWASSADNTYPTTIKADVSTTYEIAANSAVAIVRRADGMVIDGVGWGSVHSNAINSGYCETQPYPTNPGDGQSLQRKVSDTTDEDGAHGPAWDTDNNSADFFIQDSPNPQNSGSDPLPPTAELPTIILFSAGLIALATFLVLKRHKRVKVIESHPSP